MHRRHLMTAGLVAGACLGLAGPAFAVSPPDGKVMPLGHPVVAPAGFRVYCQTSPENCLNAAPEPLALARREPYRASGSGLWSGAFAQARSERDVATGAVDRTVVTYRAAPGTANGEALSAAVSGLWATAFSQARGQRAMSPAGPAVPVRRSSRPDWQLGPTRVTVATLPAVEAHRRETSAPSEVVVLDRSTRALLQRINNTMNRTIVAARDEDLHGADVWGARRGGDGRYYGDCEDYALAKRDALLRHGLPAHALSLVVARTRAGETHAVLVVTTDRGDYVLDNLSYWVRPWEEVDYRWIARQNAGEASDWRAVAPPLTQTPSSGLRRNHRRS